jgi:tRNA threonylcarbamoyl adenosine modification protein (Sua5/YciO/YrdC/YwlC family)
MIEYVVPANIDDRIVARAAARLRAGELVALPTDTTWIIACSFAAKEGVKRLRALSGERDERHFTLLCSEIAQFGGFCVMDNRCFRVLNKYTPGPYVFILKTQHGTDKTLGLKRSELGVRIPGHPLPRALVRALGAPLYTITAKRSMCAAAGGLADGDDDYDGAADSECGGGDAFPQTPESALFECGWELDDIRRVGVVLDTGEELARRFSTVVDLCGAQPRILRQGAGAFSV